MKVLKVLLAVLGALTLFLGLVFLIGGRPVSGAVILLSGVFMLVMGLSKPRTRDVIVKQELELTGDMTLESMKCRQCGSTLSAESTLVKAGTVFIACPYCGSEYQLEEAPKW